MKKYILTTILLSFSILFTVNIFAQGCEEPDSDGGDDTNKPKVIGIL